MTQKIMAAAEPKYHVLNSRNKYLLYNGVLILPNCVIVISRFKLAQYPCQYLLNVMQGLNWPPYIYGLKTKYLHQETNLLVLVWHNGTWILPKICSFWISNVMLGLNWPPYLYGLKWIQSFIYLPQDTIFLT